MSMHRWNPRRDDNERPIIAALKAVGAEVRPVNDRRICDLVVGFRQKTYLLGVKKRGWKAARERGVKVQESGDVKPKTWNGGPWEIVETPEEALEVLGLGMNVE